MINAGFEEGAPMQQSTWPELPAFVDWKETFTTLHLWTQVVGKIRPAHSPQLNHS